MSRLTLCIVTPTGTQPTVMCDSIHLSVQDNQQGKGGGRYGIRAGHTQALLSVAPGKVEAFEKGKIIFQCHCGLGFATVENNQITLVVEYCLEKTG